MTQPKVSIVVPTYNQAQYLGACLDSIWFQDYPCLEVIVVNDCSTDQTTDVLKEFAQAVTEEKVSYASCLDPCSGEIKRTFHPRYPRGRELIIINNQRNLGSTRTYNLGFKQCTGKYCTYVASDDLCHPQMISSMVQVLESEPVDFVYSDMFIINDQGRILRQFSLPDWDFEACLGNWYLLGVSKLYRYCLHERHGYYNEEYLANDHECYLRFALQGARFKHIPKVLYSVRSHAGREQGVHSTENWQRLLQESCSLVQKARKYLQATPNQPCTTGLHHLQSSDPSAKDEKTKEKK